MPYAYLSLSALLTQLSEKLDDPNFVYWNSSELTAYIQEAMRCWQSLSGYWRARMAFNTSASTPFYDLTAQTGTLIPFTLKDSDVVSEMLYHLLEPQLAGGLYAGTDMFVLDDITKALERRRNQFLVETGMVLTVSTVNAGIPPVSRVQLADNVIDVRRVALISQGTPYGFGPYGAGPYGGTGIKTPIWRTNEFGAQAYDAGWAQNPSDPTIGYSVAVTPPVTIALIPPQANAAQLELVTLNAGAVLNPAVGVLMGVPDNLAWVVKWGALADLLSKSGVAQDLPRAAYCEQRYREGIKIARIHTSAVWAAIDGVETFISAIDSFDAYRPDWEASVAPPKGVALGSWNLLALSPVPDTNNHSVRLDVVQNAPVPVLGTDKVQVGREELDVLIEYAQHLALFKIGGGEFLETAPLYDNMLQMAALFNERLQAQVDYLRPMADRAVREEQLRPRRAPVEMTQEA